MKNKIYLSLALVAMLCLVGWTGFAQKSSHARLAWEYKVVAVYGTTELPPVNLTQFNQMGAEGWELVSILSEDFTRNGSQQRKAEYYFKRAR
jgi:hypothetical protein